MKAFSVKSGASIYILKEPVKMSYGFPKLSEIAFSGDKNSEEKGDLFVFWNKKKTYIKILYWAHNGMCIFAKKLPRGTFAITGTEGGTRLAELTEIVDHIVLNGSRKKRHLKKAA